jgi:GNAT superfamily N-acetyltransferase
MPVTRFRDLYSKEHMGNVDYKLEHYNNQLQLRLNLIFLEEKCRGKGFGKTIMADVIKKAKRLGCKKIILSVKDPEYNVFSSYDFRKKFFEKFGFQFDGDGFGVLNLQNELDFHKFNFQ